MDKGLARRIARDHGYTYKKAKSCGSDCYHVTKGNLRLKMCYWVDTEPDLLKILLDIINADNKTRGTTHV